MGKGGICPGNASSALADLTILPIADQGQVGMSVICGAEVVMVELATLTGETDHTSRP